MNHPTHFTNISTVACSVRGHGYEEGKSHSKSIERQGDVGWGVATRNMSEPKEEPWTRKPAA